MHKEKTDKFIVGTTKILNDKKYLLNEFRRELYMIYRRFWCYFFHNKEKLILQDLS